MLRPDDRITGIDYDDELETVVVRTDRETDFEDKLKKKTLTSGCAQGTVFGDLMEKFDEVRLDPEAILRTSWLYALTPQDQHRAEPLSRRRRDPWLRAVRGGPAAALHGGCRPAQRDRQDRRLHAPQRRLARRQDLLHHRPPDLRDGDQDRADGDSDPDLALGLHRLGGRACAAGRAHPDRPRQGQAVRGARRRRAHRLRRRSAGRSRTSTRGSRARRASPRRTRREGRRRCCSRAGSRGAWAAATRRCACWAGGRCSIGSSSGCGRRSRRWCSTPTAIRPGSRASACRWSPTALPDFAGPLAGVLAGLDWAAANRPDCP